MFTVTQNNYQILIRGRSLTDLALCKMMTEGFVAKLRAFTILALKEAAGNAIAKHPA